MSVAVPPLSVVYRPVASLIPYAGNARQHSKRQLQKLARSIETYGWVNPLIVDERGMVLCGHGRLAAAAMMHHRQRVG